MDAALVAGAGHGRMLRTVLLPEAAPDLIIGLGRTLVVLVGHILLAGVVLAAVGSTAGSGLGGSALGYVIAATDPVTSVGPAPLAALIVVVAVMVRLPPALGKATARGIDHG